MTCGLATALEPPHFNHAPVRGAIGASFSRRSRAGSFNPRTRVGCDQCVCVSCLQLHCVSIHAPAWGATTSIWQARNSRPVSIHAPAWGATCRHVRQRACLRVSIHAPAWGATLKASGVFLLGHCFNPRTRVGCDGRIVRDQLQGEAFQSTHPRGVRLFPCFIQ